MTLSPRFDVALSFASRLHSRQVRKGTSIPYISHLLAVTSLALEFGADEDEAIAALLHDAIEDQGGGSTEETITRLFGENVARIVRGCTDADVTPKPPWEERKRAYIAHLEHASPSVRLISCCDKLHNARAILRDYEQLGESLWERFTGGKGGVLWYYGELAEAFLRLSEDAQRSKAVAQELDSAVRELEDRSGIPRGQAGAPATK